jgi:hypothetical protein
MTIICYSLALSNITRKFRSVKQRALILREKPLRCKLEIQGKVVEQAMRLRY